MYSNAMCTFYFVGIVRLVATKASINPCLFLRWIMTSKEVCLSEKKAKGIIFSIWQRLNMEYKCVYHTNMRFISGYWRTVMIFRVANVLREAFSLDNSLSKWAFLYFWQLDAKRIWRCKWRNKIIILLLPNGYLFYIGILFNSMHLFLPFHWRPFCSRVILLLAIIRFIGSLLFIL